MFQRNAQTGSLHTTSPSDGRTRQTPARGGQAVRHHGEFGNQKSKMRNRDQAWPLLSLRFKRLGLTGLEPVTLRLSSACSNQLSYRPVAPTKRHLRSKIERRCARIPLI